jgi:hypothetical protein
MPNKNLKIEWLPNYLAKKIHNNILKSWFKFIFLTKSFKEKINTTFLKPFLNEMIKNIIYILLILLKFQNLWNLINVFMKKNWKCLFKCFLWFFKIQWVQGNQAVMFLVVPWTCPNRLLTMVGRLPRPN